LVPPPADKNKAFLSLTTTSTCIIPSLKSIPAQASPFSSAEAAGALCGQLVLPQLVLPQLVLPQLVLPLADQHDASQSLQTLLICVPPLSSAETAGALCGQLVLPLADQHEAAPSGGRDLLPDPTF